MRGIALTLARRRSRTCKPGIPRPLVRAYAPSHPDGGPMSQYAQGSRGLAVLRSRASPIALALRGPALQALSLPGSYDLCASRAAARGDRCAAPDAFSSLLSGPRLRSQPARLQARHTLKRRPTREGRTCFAAKPFPTRSARSYQALSSLAGNAPAFPPWLRLAFTRQAPVSQARHAEVSRQ